MQKLGDLDGELLKTMCRLQRFVQIIVFFFNVDIKSIIINPNIAIENGNVLH